MRLRLSAEQFVELGRSNPVVSFVDTFYDTHGMQLLSKDCWLLRREYSDGREEWKLRAFVNDENSELLEWVDFCGNESTILDVLHAFSDECTKHSSQPFVCKDATLYQLFPRMYLTLPTARIEVKEWVVDAVGWMTCPPRCGGAYVVCSYECDKPPSEQVMGLVDTTPAPSKARNKKKNKKKQAQ
jgi:hypothetical protein